MKPITLWSAPVIALVAGCASVVKSVPLERAPRREGVVYYLPKKLVKVTVQQDAKGNWLTAMEVLAAVPDRSRGYVAQLHHNPGASDVLTVGTTDAGLLSKVEWNTEDASGEIVVALAQAAVQIAKLGVLGGGPAALAPGAPIKYEVDFDPTVPASVEAANRVLAGADLMIECRERSSPGGETSTPSEATEVKGIVYPRPVLYRVEVCGLENGPEPLLSREFVLPNRGDLAVIPLSTGAFVETKYAMTFQDGMLTQMSATRPSEVLGFVQIIPNLLKEIVSIPGEILQLKIDYSSKEKELAEVQKTLIEAQRALLEAQNQP